MTTHALWRRSINSRTRSMYREDPITADYMYWDTGGVRKDLTSPWAMFVAMHAKEGNMAPAALSHAYLPFFLILICYALYLLIGQVLFGGDWEKTFLFGIVLSVLHLAGYTSTHTLASMLLLRIWQGKAVSAQASRFRCFSICFIRSCRKRRGSAGFHFSMWRVWARACFPELVS